MTTPEGWQWTEVEPGIGFSVPPNGQRGTGLPVDSTAGLFDGDGYRITFDLGRFGERLDALKREPQFRSRSRTVAGRTGLEVGFRPSDEPFAWARIVQVDAGSGRTLSVRVSCDSPERCSIADDIFDSVRID